MKELARVFKALADETRLKLLALVLVAGELCVCECMDLLKITQSKASRHLRYLANSGLLDDYREGTWVHYRVPRELDPQRRRVLELARELALPKLDQELLRSLESLLRERRNRSNQACG